MTTSNLLLIDSRILDVDYIIGSLASNTDYIVFDYYLDTFDGILSRIKQKKKEHLFPANENMIYQEGGVAGEPWFPANVGIVQHNYGGGVGKYQFLDCMRCGEWMRFFDFLSALKENGMKTLDWCSCSLWGEPDWKHMMVGIEKLHGIRINAAAGEIGNGNYWMDRGEVNLIGKYFVEKIMGYRHTFSSGIVVSNLNFNTSNYALIEFTSLGTQPDSYITEISYNTYDDAYNNYGNYTISDFTIAISKDITVNKIIVSPLIPNMLNTPININFSITNNYGEYTTKLRQTTLLSRNPSVPVISQLSYFYPNTVFVKTDAPYDTGSYYLQYYIRYNLYNIENTLVYNSEPKQHDDLNPKEFTIPYAFSSSNKYTLKIRFSSYPGTFSSETTREIQTWDYPPPPSLSNLSTGVRSATINYNQASTGGYPITKYDISYTNLTTSTSHGYTLENPPPSSGTITIPDLTFSQQYTDFAVLASNQYASSISRSSISGIIIPIDYPFTPTIASASIINTNVQINLSAAYSTYESWGLYSSASLSQTKITFAFHSTQPSTQTTTIDVPISALTTSPTITIPVSYIQSKITSISAFAYNGYVNSPTTNFSTTPIITTDSVSPDINVAYKMIIAYTIQSFYPLTGIQYSFNGTSYASALYSSTYYISTASSPNVYVYPTIYLKYAFSDGTIIQSPNTKSSICYSKPDMSTNIIVNSTAAMNHIAITLTQLKIGQSSPNFRYQFTFTSTSTNLKTNKYETPVYSGTPTTYTYEYDLSGDKYLLEIYAKNDSALTEYKMVGYVSTYDYPKNLTFTILPNYLSGVLTIAQNIETALNTGGFPLTKCDILFQDQTNLSNIITYTHTSPATNDPIVIKNTIPALEGKKTYNVKIIAYNQFLNSQNDTYQKTLTPYSAPNAPYITSLTWVGSNLSVKVSPSLTPSKYQYGDWGYGVLEQNTSSSNKFICVLNTESQQPFPLDSDPALLVYYPFNSAETATQNRGSTGASNDCVLTNAAITSLNYKFGYGSLRGERSNTTSSYFTVKNTISIGQQFTQSFWIFMSVTTSNGATLMSYTASASALISNTWWDAKIRFNIIGAQYLISESIPLKTWTHIAFTLNDSTISLYINGRLHSNATNIDTSWKNKIYDNVILCKSEGYYYVKEPILYDDFRIYNRELSAAEILSLYNYQYQFVYTEASSIVSGINQNVLTFAYDSAKYTLKSVQVIATNNYSLNSGIYSAISAPYSAAPILYQVQIQEIKTQAYAFGVYITDASCLTAITKVTCILNDTNTVISTAQQQPTGYYLFSGLLDEIFYYSTAKFQVTTREGDSNFITYSNQINVYDYPTAPTIVSVQRAYRSIILQLQQGFLEQVQNTYNYRIELTPLTGTETITYTTEQFVWSAPSTTNTITVPNVPSTTEYSLKGFTINLAGLEAFSLYESPVKSYDYPEKPTIASIVSGQNSIKISYLPPVLTGGFPIINYHVSATNTKTNAVIELDASPSVMPIVIQTVPGEQYTNFQLTAQNAYLTSQPATSSLVVFAYTFPKQPIIYDVSFLSHGVLSVKTNKIVSLSDWGYLDTRTYSLIINGTSTYNIPLNTIQQTETAQYFSCTINEALIQNIKIAASNGELTAESAIFSVTPNLASATYTQCYDTPFSFFVNLVASYNLSPITAIEYTTQLTTAYTQVAPTAGAFKVTMPSIQILYYPTIYVRFLTSEGISNTVQIANVYVYNYPSAPQITEFGITDTSPLPNSLVVKHKQTYIGQTSPLTISFTYTFTDELNDTITYQAQLQPWGSQTTGYSFVATGLSSLKKYRCTIKINNASILSAASTTAQQANPYSIPAYPTVSPIITLPSAYSLTLRAPPIEQRGGYAIANYIYSINNTNYRVTPNASSGIDFSTTIFATAGTTYNISAATIITYTNIAGTSVQVQSAFSPITTVTPASTPISPAFVGSSPGYKQIVATLNPITREEWGYADVSGYMVYIDGAYYKHIAATNATYTTFVIPGLEPKPNYSKYLVQVYGINQYFTSVASLFFEEYTYKEPAQPEPPSITSLNRAALMQFTPPNDNNSAIDKCQYVLTNLTESTVFPAIEYVNDGNAHEIPGLKATHQYSVKISAHNAGEWSPYSIDSLPIAVDAVPDMPIQPVSQFFRGNYSLYQYGYVDVSFIVPENYESGVTEYAVYINSLPFPPKKIIVPLSSPAYKGETIVYRHSVDKTYSQKEITCQIQVKNAVGYGELSAPTPAITAFAREPTQILYGYYYRSTKQLKIRFTTYLFDALDFQQTLQATYCFIYNKQYITSRLTYLGENMYECVCDINIPDYEIFFSLVFLFNNGVATPRGSIASIPITPTPNPPVIKNAVYNPYLNQIAISFSILESYNFNIPITSIEFSLNNSTYIPLPFTYQPTVQGATMQLSAPIAFEQPIYVRALNQVEYSLVPNNYLFISFPPSKPTSSTFLCEAGNLSLNIIILSKKNTQPQFPILSYTYFIYNSQTDELVKTGVYAANPLTSYIYIPGLAKNTDYYATLLATNINGDSLVSLKSNSVTVYGVPSPPSFIDSIPEYKGCSGLFQVGDANSSPLVSSTVEVVLVNDNDAIVGLAKTVVLAPTADKFSITGLTANQKYKVAIYSANAAGNSEKTYSPVLIPFKEPDDPVLVSVEPKKQALLVEWNTPNSNSSPIIKYKIQVRSAGILVKTEEAANTENAYTVDLLNANTPYEIKVIANNLGGDSVASNAIVAIPYKEPNAPYSATAVSGFLSVIVHLNPTPPYDNSSPITQYQLSLYSADADTLIESQTAVEIDTPVIFNTNIVEDTPYYVIVYAFNAGGISPASPPSPIAYPYGIPLLPQINAVIPGNQQLQISWSEQPENQYNPITKYRYKITYMNGAYNELSGNLAESPKTIYNLIANHEYTVFLSSYNGVWADYGEGVSVVVYNVPNAPVIEQIAPLLNSAEIQFIVPFNNSNQIKTFQFIDTNTEYILPVFLADIRFTTDENQVEHGKYIINNLLAGTQYKYKMTATNDAGKSARSSAFSVVPYKLPETPIIKAITPSNESVYISLELNNGYSKITHIYVAAAAATPTPAYEIAPSDIVYLYPQEFPQIEKCTVYIKKQANLLGFTNGNLYKLNLYVSNAAGSSPIVTTPFFVPFGIPAAPTYTLEYDPITHLLSVLEILSPTSNGNPITKYQYSLTGSLAELEGNVVNGTKIMLHAGVQYNIIFVAINAAGTSPASLPYNITTQPDIPEPPIITKIDTYENRLDVYFTSLFSGGYPIDSYYYTVVGGKYENVAFNPTDATPDGSLKKYTISAEIYPLTEYSVSIKSHNQLGYSLPSNTVKVTTPSTPTRPTINNIFQHTANQIDVMITPSLENGASISAYYLKICHINPSTQLPAIDISLSYPPAVAVNRKIIVDVSNLPFLYNSAYFCDLYSQNRIGASPVSTAQFGYHLPQLPDFTAVSTTQTNKRPTIVFDLCNNILPFCSYKYQYVGIDSSSTYIETTIYPEKSLVVNAQTQKQIILPLLTTDAELMMQYYPDAYLIHILFKNPIVYHNEVELYVLFYVYNNTSLFITSSGFSGNVENINQIVSYSSNPDSVMDYCVQKRMLALYNIPYNRFEIKSPYDGTFSKKQLDMRRKTEILKYLNNKNTNKTNNMTKREKYSYSMTNYTKAKGDSLAYLVDACMNPACRPPKPASSSGVPGTELLYEDTNVPLYNFKLTTTEVASGLEEDPTIPSYVYSSYNLYAYAVTYDISTAEWGFHTSQNTILQNNVEKPVGVLILSPTVSAAQLTYLINMPIGMLLMGTSLDLSNQVHKITVYQVTTRVYFNSNEVVEITDYTPSSLMPVLFQPTVPAKDFYLSLFLGTYPVQFTIYTSPNYVYNISCLIFAKITTFDSHNNEIEKKIRVPIQYIFNMDNDKNMVKNVRLL